VVGFESRTEAERFLREFRERLAKFGLELRPEKTRLIQFGRFAAQNRKERGMGKPETFTFLGFTHYCGKRRKDGAFTVWRTTAKKRMMAKLLAIKAELNRHRLRRLWWMVLIHRSQRGDVGWERLKPLLDRWIPPPRVLHPYPVARFDAKYPRRKPYA
jgi:RNA-directed DNA polymerase